MSSSISTATITTRADVPVTSTSIIITSITLPISSTSSSAKGFFQNTGAVAGTFAAATVVLLALLTLFATCLIRHRRRVICDREASVEAANGVEPALLENKHNNPHEGGIARTYSDTSVYGTYVPQLSATTSKESSEESVSGVAGVGAGHVAWHDGAYSRQDRMYTNDMHVQSHSANPIPTSFRSTFYSSDNILTPKQSTRTSQDAQAQGRGHGYYNQLLQAAGLDPRLCSSHSAVGSGGIQRGMLLSHEHKFYVFRDPYEAPQSQQSSPPQVLAAERQGGTGVEAGIDDAYGGYVEEHEHVH